MIQSRKHQQASAYGTLDFTAALAAREAALGIGVAVAEKPLAVTLEAPPAAGTPAIADATPADDAPYGRDAWGNIITAPRGWYGQYAVHSWRRDQRTVYVCGEPERHARAGHWRLDGRMERGQGYVCRVCHTLEAERYAEKANRGREP